MHLVDHRQEGKRCAAISPFIPVLTKGGKGNSPFRKGGMGDVGSEAGFPPALHSLNLNSNPPLGPGHALIQLRSQEDGRRPSLNLQADDLILLGLRDRLVER